jgi:hypothetical protein
VSSPALTRHLPVALVAVAALFLAGAGTTPQTAYSVKSDGDDALYSLDLRSGEARRLGPTGFADVESLAFSPGCAQLYGIDDVRDLLLACNRDNGACTAVGPLQVDVTDTGLAFSHDGRLFMSTDAPKPPRLYQIDLVSGRADLVGNQGVEITGLTGRHPTAACPSGLHGLEGDANAASKPARLFCLDTGSGAATAIGRLEAVDPVDGGIEFSNAGALWGLEDEGTIFAIDAGTGRAGVVHRADPSRRGFESLAIDDGTCAGLRLPPALDVPAAPWALALLAVALAVGGLLLSRRLTG